jgi:UDP-3-O-[3-hydroxymyristoyl] glucosamine N-acyltransferase
VGDDSRLYPSVTVYRECRIGARAILHSGVVIGADGFGMANEGGRWLKIPQLGRVVIGDDVEIGANTTVDRGALDDTVIEEGVKLDNQIQVGHNCRIGAHTAIAGCVGIAGSTVIGKHCAIGGGAGILGHLTICDHVTISACTVITRSIRQPGMYSGVFPFDDNKSWARNAAQLRHLAELAERVRELIGRVRELEERLGAKEKGNG